MAERDDTDIDAVCSENIFNLEVLSSIDQIPIFGKLTRYCQYRQSTRLLI
jgi:hypothetical protein